MRWDWHGETAKGIGQTHLGSLELFGDSLLLEVNSRSRMTRGRAILERIPGVRFLRFTEKDLDPRTAEPPLDDRLPAADESDAELEEFSELPAEATEAIRAHLRKTYFAWLDESIPALGDQTPRQACADDDGRRMVRNLIQTYPDPGGLPGVTVPRTEMLAELGLDHS